MCNFSDLRFAAFSWVPVTVVMEPMEVLSPGIIIPLLTQSSFFKGKGKGKSKRKPFLHENTDWYPNYHKSNLEWRSRKLYYFLY